jgi:hypothetical protein
VQMPSSPAEGGEITPLCSAGGAVCFHSSVPAGPWLRIHNVRGRAGTIVIPNDGGPKKSATIPRDSAWVTLIAFTGSRKGRAS